MKNRRRVLPLKGCEDWTWHSNTKRWNRFGCRYVAHMSKNNRKIQRILNNIFKYLIIQVRGMRTNGVRRVLCTWCALVCGVYSPSNRSIENKKRGKKKKTALYLPKPHKSDCITVFPQTGLAPLPPTVHLVAVQTIAAASLCTVFRVSFF